MRRFMAYTFVGLISFVVVACGSDVSSAGSRRASRGTVTATEPINGVSESASEAPSPTPALFATGCGEGLIDLSGRLSGSWRGSDGGVYYLRQAGECLWWFGTHLTELEEAGGQPGWANVAVGRIVEDKIYVEWSDVPLGTTMGRGTLILRMSDGYDYIETIDQPQNGDFGASSWNRIRPSPSASQP